MAPVAALWSKWKPWWLSVGAGALLGCMYRATFDPRWGKNGSALVMTIAFLGILPFCMGYITVDTYLRRTAEHAVPWYGWFFLPWLSVVITMAVSVAVKWEGLVCVIFAAPLMLIASALGGVLARVMSRRSKHPAPGAVGAFALPLLAMLIELQFASPWQIRSVETDMLIHAPAGIVWKNIESVRAIAPSELPDSWVNRIGFPRPVAATLSHEGKGGVRAAAFTGGLVFTETITEWREDSDLRFSIRANTESIARTTLDEHVTIGGAFFDVLEGEYRIETRPGGVLLRLISQERVSTHFNPYAGLWSDRVMRSIQEQILEVIRRRCESEGENAFEATQ